MPRGVKATPVETTDDGAVAEKPPESGISISTEGTIVPVTPNPDTEPVSTGQFNDTVTALRNEISDLKSLLADLEAVVTAPAGAVQFYDIGTPDEVGDDDDVPEYLGVQESFNRGPEDAPWFKP